MKNSVIYFLILTIIANIAALPGMIFPSLRNGNALLYSVSVCKENKKKPPEGQKNHISRFFRDLRFKEQRGVIC